MPRTGQSQLSYSSVYGGDQDEVEGMGEVEGVGEVEGAGEVKGVGEVEGVGEGVDVGEEGDRDGHGEGNSRLHGDEARPKVDKERKATAAYREVMRQHLVHETAKEDLDLNLNGVAAGPALPILLVARDDDEPVIPRIPLTVPGRVSESGSGTDSDLFDSDVELSNYSEAQSQEPNSDDRFEVAPLAYDWVRLGADGHPNNDASSPAPEPALVQLWLPRTANVSDPTPWPVVLECHSNRPVADDDREISLASCGFAVARIDLGVHGGDRHAVDSRPAVVQRPRCSLRSQRRKRRQRRGSQARRQRTASVEARVALAARRSDSAGLQWRRSWSRQRQRIGGGRLVNDQRINVHVEQTAV